MRYTVVRQKFKPHLALWTTTVFNEHDCWIVFFRRLLLMDRGFQLLLDNLTSTLFEAYFYYPDVTSWKFFYWNASRHELTEIIQMIWALLTFEKSVLISDWIKGILIVLFVSQITHGTTYRVERFKHNHVACSNASCGCPKAKEVKRESDRNVGSMRVNGQVFPSWRLLVLCQSLFPS